MNLKPRTLATGMLSFLPGARKVYHRHFFHPGEPSAMGSYGIWLKHLCLARSNGMRGIPRTVVELGPGNSIGVGLAAMICGASQYYGLDAVPALDRGDTLSFFDELVALVRARTAPLNAQGYLSYGGGGFPHDVLPSGLLDPLLSADRLQVFDSHGTTPAWNGHWGCPSWQWNLALGRKDFLVNRVPHSRLLTAIRQSGLELAADLVHEDTSGICRESLNDEWVWLHDSDLVVRDAFVVVRKPAEPAASR